LAVSIEALARLQSQTARSVEQVSVFKTMVDKDLLIAQFVSPEE